MNQLISEIDNAIEVMEKNFLIKIDFDFFHNETKVLELRKVSVVKALDCYNELKNAYPEIESLDIRNLTQLFITDFVNNSNHRLLLAYCLKNDVEILTLTEIIKELEELQKVRSRTAEVFDFSSIDYSVNYLHHSNTIKESGVLRIFSPSYWKAKNIYKKISKTKYNRMFASSHFRLVNEYLLQVSLIKQKTIDTFDEELELNVEMLNSLVDAMSNFNSFSLGEFDRLGNMLGKLGKKDIDYIKDNHLDNLRCLSSYKGIDALEGEIEEIEEKKKDFEKQVKYFTNIEQQLVNSQDEITKEYLVQVKNNVRQFKEKFDTIDFEIFQHKSWPLDIDSLKKLKRKLEVVHKVVTLKNDEIEALLTLHSHETHKARNEAYDLIKMAKEFVEIYDYIQKITGCDKALWQVPISESLSHLNKAENQIGHINKFLKFLSLSRDLNKIGMDSFLSKLNIEDTNVSYENIFVALFYRGLVKRTIRKDRDIYPIISKLDMNEKRLDFSRLDKSLIEHSRMLVRSNLKKEARPPKGHKSGKRKNWTEIEFIKNEINKKKRFSSVRTLIGQASDALLELMPCWMMSPMAVSQYLRKGVSDFDLVIIDEASQMTPENAVGALFRAREAMIVGDTNQLPPTNFFRKSLGILDDEDSGYTTVEESILEKANLSLYPQRRLRWHYRSKHSSLIAFSNQYIYNNELEIFPSPNEDSNEEGVSLVEVENGVYSSSVNMNEARVVVDHIIKEMEKHPDKSIGVVTLNQKQKDLVEEELTFAIKDNIRCRNFVKSWEYEKEGLESFFVKNLENVQGDERDTIFISTVYGPSEVDGRVMQRFGPINGPAGKRRLNVLFTRAKLKIVTFTSMSPNDILAAGGPGSGAWILKKWLEYSKTKHIDKAIAQNKEPDSDFERHVIRVIESLGCVAIPQVGVSGYYIDIGVRHPSWDYGFLLGIECDGASYHSSKSARDRDRLREEVLNGIGWDIYRIWSTDWFEDPIGETKKLRTAIELKLKEKLAS